MAMCPVCLKEMEIFECFGIELDTCKLCGGLWFDGGEIDKLTTVKNIPKRLTQPVAYDFSQKKIEEGDRTCPRCDVIMAVTDYNGVSIDICPQCKGMWFDRYELGKAIGETDGMPKKDFNYESFEVDKNQYNAITGSHQEAPGLLNPLGGICDNAVADLTETTAYTLTDLAMTIILDMFRPK
jgi:Zn-finger nucleic acid-binding protein